MVAEQHNAKWRSNRLLAALSEEDFRRMEPDFTEVKLKLRQVIHEPGQESPWVHFPISGLISLITVLENGWSIELASLGNEGFVDISVFLGLVSSETFTLVQVPGEALRISSEKFRAHLDEMPELRRLAGAYVMELFTMTAQSNACNRAHTTDQRLARWLLHTHDRAVADTFPMTHEFLSTMLGATRPVVTTAAGVLRDQGLIELHRGSITVLDRAALEARACECYGIIRHRFDHLAEEAGIREQGSRRAAD